MQEFQNSAEADPRDVRSGSGSDSDSGSGSDIPSSSSSEGTKDEEFYNSMDSDNQQDYNVSSTNCYHNLYGSLWCFFAFSSLPGAESYFCSISFAVGHHRGRLERGPKSGA